MKIQLCIWFNNNYTTTTTSNFFLRLQKCMHAFGVKLDYNNTF